jgi:hypothetical protein
VSSLTRQEPPRAPVRANGWPVHRTPRWLLLAVAALLVVAVAVALVHKPSQAERASDMRGLLQEVTTDIESCAGGVGESLTALHLVQAEHGRNASDVSDAVSIAQQGADNCAPANNEQIDDLVNYQVPESLDSFGLMSAVSGLVSWAAPDAEQVQTDVAQVLDATTPQAKSEAQAALSRALDTLNAQRAAVYAPVDKAIKALALHLSPPRLPG